MCRIAPRRWTKTKPLSYYLNAAIYFRRKNALKILVIAVSVSSIPTCFNAFLVIEMAEGDSVASLRVKENPHLFLIPKITLAILSLRSTYLVSLRPRRLGCFGFRKNSTKYPVSALPSIFPRSSREAASSNKNTWLVPRPARASFMRPEIASSSPDQESYLSVRASSLRKSSFSRQTIECQPSSPRPRQFNHVGGRRCHDIAEPLCPQL
jgi:hypothetical protein